MTGLKCSVSTCVHYSDNCCCKDSIYVEGAEARSVKETCCGSFEENNGGFFKNVFKTPESKLRIECDVEKCMYNDGHLCRAEQVNIVGDGARVIAQTSCGSFREKA